MAIILGDNIQINGPLAVDSRYLNDLVPYTSVSGANSTIVSGVRYAGLTVNINGVEYWYKDGIGDGDLIVKDFGGTIVGAVNGLHTESSGTTVALGGDLTGNTTIDGVGIWDLSITNIGGFQVSTSGETAQILLEPAGMTLSYSGVSGTSSVSLESIAGLTYDGNYRNDFTEYSLPDAGYVTGLTSSIVTAIDTYTGTTAPNTFLKLDQTVPQDVCYGQPFFHEGLILHEFPTPSLVTGHTSGKMFYDPFYETITAQIGHPDTYGNAVNLQLGQEMHRLVWNETGAEILNGDAVRTVTTHCGAGSCADAPAVCLAKADTMVCANVIGVATQVISASTYGFITTVGYVSDIDTTSGKYSGFTAGDIIYLSPTVEGGVTNIPPVSPNVKYRLGRLTTTGTTGKLNVDLELVYRLDDLADVNAPIPSLDDTLKWNGLDWVNAAAGSSSASAGINFYYATPVINSRTQPAGISQNGASGSGIQVATLSRTPVTTGSTLIIGGTDASLGDIRAFVAWGQDVALNRTTIDAGLWEFYDYAYVGTTPGEVYIIHQMYQVVPVSGITTTGSGIPRTATITNSGFTGTYFNASPTNTLASYLQTPSGIFQISAITDTNNVTIITPLVSGYTNETGVNGSIWNPLFSGTTEDIVATTTTLYQTKIIAPAFNVSPTDKLGHISFVDTTAGGVVLNLSYNGTSAASFFISPLATLHNELAGLQGGSGNQRYHVYQSGATLLGDITATAAEINVLDGIPPTLTSTELGYVDGVTSDIQTQLNSKLAITTFTGYTATTSTLINSKLATTTFTGYTASTQPIIDNAITGATNFGTGTTVYSGTTGRTLNFSTIVGSGSVSVQKVGNEIVIYSSGGTGSEYVFTSDIVVSIASGKTFGKYENGETVPASGKTAVQVIQMALAEALDPTVSLSSSGDNVVFGASGKTVNLTFSYTINTYGASVASALVEWRRGGTGAWSALTTTTGTPSGYTHNIDDSANRFNTAVLNYRYTVVDTAAATGQTTYDVVPQAYAVPTYSPSYVGSLLGYETQQLREKGNTGTTISGGISSNRSLVCIKGYTIQRCVNGGGWSTVDSCAGLCSLTPSIASCLDTGAAGTATSIGYRVAVCDDWCSVTPNCSSTYTINYRYASYYGYCTSASISGAQIVALGNAALCSSRARTMVLTATGGNYTYLSYPESYGYLTSAIMDGAAPVLGAFSCSGSNSVTNAYGQTCNYILYKSNATDAFSANSVAFS